MKDAMILLTGREAGTFCRGLLETGKFLRLRTVPMGRASRLYGAGGSNSCIFPRRPTHRDWTPLLCGEMWADREKDESPDNKTTDTKPEPQIVKSPACAFSPEYTYVVCASQPVAAVVLEAVKSHSETFRMREEPHLRRQVLQCNGTRRETAAALDDIRRLLTQRQSA